jgi:hypothetical protein
MALVLGLRTMTATMQQKGPLHFETPPFSLFARLISHQLAVLFSQNESATSRNQPAVTQNKSAPAISHQPTEQAVCLLPSRIHYDFLLVWAHFLAASDSLFLGCVVPESVLMPPTLGSI